MKHASPSQTQSPKAHHISRVEVDGRLGWRKQVESLGFSLRLCKGDPTKSFETEKANYLSCQKRGLPVPEFLDVGDGYFVTADAGSSLAQLRKLTLESPEIFQQALVDAAGALARLHQAGFYR